MEKTSKSEKIPKEMHVAHAGIVELIERYCELHLNEDYTKIARKIIELLCCIQPSPVAKGHINTWACGIIYTLCSINHLFEENQDFYINPLDVCNYFDVSATTGPSRSEIIIETLQIDPNTSSWCLKRTNNKSTDISQEQLEKLQVIKPVQQLVATPVEQQVEQIQSEQIVDKPAEKKESKKSKAKESKKDVLKVNDCVRVKKGIIDPDFPDTKIEGWLGRITEIVKEAQDEGDKDDQLLDIMWDSFTLRAMSDDFIDRCEEAGLDCLSMYLRLSDVEKAKTRDTLYDVQEAQDEIRQYLDKPVVGMMDEQYKRIQEILNNEDITVNKDNLVTYLDYIEENIALPCQLTGREPFQWEIAYLDGTGKKKDYDKLRKTRPSHTDTFKLIHIDGEVERDEGVFVKVERVSDSKKFSLPLFYLKITDDKSTNYQLIDDYSTWFVKNK
ncbi:MAG: hypothetical protein HQL06_07525 [Nitrospirae bacterium]|nr:hypothetical protein [Nitrospirota bacterium]